jgi:hypothetical protein
MGLPVLLEEICRLILGVYKSQTHECGNWDWGRAIPRKGIYKRNCRCSAGPHKHLKVRAQREERLREREEGCHCRQGLSLCQLRVKGLCCQNKTTAKKSGPLLKSIQFKEQNDYCLLVGGIFRGMRCMGRRALYDCHVVLFGKTFLLQMCADRNLFLLNFAHSLCTVNVNVSITSSKL